MKAQEKIDSAQTLDALLIAIQETQAELPDETTIDEVIDTASLPTFGGDEPADTNNIWSWDETRILTTRDGADFVIRDR